MRLERAKLFSTMRRTRFDKRYGKYTIILLSALIFGFTSCQPKVEQPTNDKNEKLLMATLYVHSNGCRLAQRFKSILADFIGPDTAKNLFLRL